MTDPSSFGTALWTLLIVSVLVVALGLAAVSDMAMRRREDRAAARHAPGAGSAAALAAPSPQGSPARGEDSYAGGADHR
ncbi:histidine kinase [Nocardiopsis sp. NPDC058631]|uniref:histidine kinase n=1 Tax=Nocardiopsis sp. NPDC058631 TaxID=3346566 RepID=UPI00365B50A2